MKKQKNEKADKLPTPPADLKGRELYSWKVKHGICGRCGKRPRGRFKACCVCRQTMRRRRAAKEAKETKSGKPKMAVVKSDYGEFPIPVKGEVEVTVGKAFLRVSVR